MELLRFLTDLPYKLVDGIEYTVDAVVEKALKFDQAYEAHK